MTTEILRSQAVLVLENFEEFAVAVRAIHRQFEPQDDEPAHRLVTSHAAGEYVERYSLFDALDTLDDARRVQPAAFVGEDRDDIMMALSTTPKTHFDYAASRLMLVAFQSPSEAASPAAPIHQPSRLSA
jgi:hypothetical protein